MWPKPVAGKSGGLSGEQPQLPAHGERCLSDCLPTSRSRFWLRPLPLEVDSQAFNPMVPYNVVDGSIPDAVFCYRLRNRSDGPVTASAAFSLPNCIGADRSSHEASCYATQPTYGPT
ncbi:hypothetical protein CMK14_21695 [Candidatus Poribacteria bacterium]|nr:hypothetical protein [Candidatus Poribacteria bacterium]